MNLELSLLTVILTALTFYGVFGGADFGAGIWEAATALTGDRRDRSLINRAMGPVWEANHVWLIFVLVLLANGFPPVFAELCRSLWLPLLLGLGGIVFRGAAFAFRAYAMDAPTQQEVWTSVFATASLAAPFFLGTAIGAIAAGELTGESPADQHAIWRWVSPLSVYTGVFSVLMCANLAAFYLTRDAWLANDERAARIWRQRSIASGSVVGVIAMGGILLVAQGAEHLRSGFVERGWPLVLGSVASGFLSVAAMWYRRYTLAVFAVIAAVGSVIVGWGVAQYPFLVPASQPIYEASAPPAVLRAMLLAILSGAVILLPAMIWLFAIFKQRDRDVDVV